MNSIRRIIFGLYLRLKLWQMPGYLDVLTMCENGNLAEASTALSERIENHPRWSKDADAYLLLANLELRKDDTRKAKCLLDKAREMGSFDQSCYHRIHAYLLWKSGQHKEAVQELERSVVADPCVFNLLAAAEIMLEVDGKRAVGLCRQALEEEPNNCAAHVYIASQAFESGDCEEAMLMASRAEQLEMSARDVFSVGGLYHELGEFETAINKYLKAKMLGYEGGELNAAIAGCYVGLGQAGSAREYLERAIRLDPEDNYVREVCTEYEEAFGKLSGGHGVPS